jgi:exodeoxyribonuclease VII large subunit
VTGKRRSLFGYDPNAGQEQDLGADDGGKSLTVTQVNSMVRQRLEREFSQISVRGELSNVVIAASGHLYANLKDGKSQISMVMWRGQRARLNFKVEDGVQVVVKARLSLYEARGSFQMIASFMSAEGTGSLEAQFRALKARFEEQGYFDPETKKPLPFLPKTIGVVTSSAGAAIHDILTTILNRFSRPHVVLLPVRVQGTGAATEIADAIDRCCAESICDVLIVGRGGGSIEDLWAFNEAEVVEAIHRADIPIISAVGHETDVTLSDMVADYRALTPTAGAEAAIPILVDLEDHLHSFQGRLGRTIDNRIANARTELNSLGRSWALKEPLNYLRRVEQRLDELGRSLARSSDEQMRQAKQRFERLGKEPGRSGLLSRLQRSQEKLAHARDRLDIHIADSLKTADLELEKQRRLLAGLSPLAVLDRGYSLTRRADGSIIRDAADLDPGEVITTRFAQGTAESEVRKDHDGSKQ